MTQLSDLPQKLQFYATAPYQCSYPPGAPGPLTGGNARGHLVCSDNFTSLV